MKLSLISAASIVCVVIGLAASTTPSNAGVTFMTFLSSGDLAAVGPWWTINAFDYTGNGFVGSIRTNRLYSTNLAGGNVRLYGEAIPGLSGGEVSVGVGLGRAGFGEGVVYVDNPKAGQICRVPSVGPPVLFGTTPQNPSKIFFDPGSTFGGDMLVTTAFGKVYRFTSSGTSTLLANVGEDTEGMAICWWRRKSAARSGRFRREAWSRA
jgi:hypothetical protein